MPSSINFFNIRPDVNDDPDSGWLYYADKGRQVKSPRPPGRGFCLTAPLRVRRARWSKRVAVAHTIYNVLAAVLTLVALYPFYVWLIPKMGGNMAHQVADVHLAIKVVSGLVFVPFVAPFSKSIAWLDVL